MAQILVVEDDRDIADLVAFNLKGDGHEVVVKNDGLEGLEAALEGNFDLIVLDLMLPSLGGLELCREVREREPYALIVMLTAKSSELDRVVGLELGADDYLSKPFSVRELQARVKALLRRKMQLASVVSEETRAIQAGRLRIDLERREVFIEGRAIGLTAKEFDLLVQFARHPGKVYTRADLLDLVWGYGYDGFEHTVNSHINRLRAKIEADPAQPDYVQTVWGVGYKFAIFD